MVDMIQDNAQVVTKGLFSVTLNGELKCNPWQLFHNPANRQPWISILQWLLEQETITSYFKLNYQTFYGRNVIWNKREWTNDNKVGFT